MKTIFNPAVSSVEFLSSTKKEYLYPRYLVWRYYFKSWKCYVDLENLILPSNRSANFSYFWILFENSNYIGLMHFLGNFFGSLILISIVLSLNYNFFVFLYATDFVLFFFHFFFLFVFFLLNISNFKFAITVAY